MIQINKNVCWDEQLTWEQQNEEAQEWLFKTVYSRLCLDKRYLTNEYVEPVWDEIGRPMKWNINADNVLVEVVREYKNLSNWAINKDLIIVKEKEA